MSRKQDSGRGGANPEFSTGDLRVRLENRVRNAPFLTALAAADRGIARTQWQRSRFPVELQSRIEVIRDGIDTDKAVPNGAARVTLKSAAGGVSPAAGRRDRPSF